MSVVRWDPFQNLTTLQDRINRLFAEAFPITRGEEGIVTGAWSPAVDIYEIEHATIVKAELPGIKKENISIDLKDNVLTISGERSAEKEVKEENYYRRERDFGRFKRSFSLPTVVNPDLIKASFKDGVLEIEIPKPDEKKPKQITIK